MGKKQLYGYFKKQTSDSAREYLDIVQKGDLKIETEFLLVAAQN